MTKAQLTKNRTKTLLIVLGNIVALLILIGAATAQETADYIYGTITTDNTHHQIPKWK